jgi:hypothetical protein
MAINLRSATGELHQKLKMRAAQEGVTIESLCVRFLWWGLDTPSGSLGGTFKDGTPDVGVVGLARLLEKKSEHDSKTCRIYKCGMCAAARE